MLLKNTIEGLLVLDKQKLVSIRSSEYDFIENNKIIAIHNDPKKTFLKVETISAENIDNLRNDYTYLEKKELIEKLELNLGSLLSYENITNIERKQFPMFNILFGDTLLAGYDLQNIYIDYFVRLLLQDKVYDVMIDKQDRSYFLNNSPVISEYNERTKYFLDKTTKSDFDTTLTMVSSNNDLIEIEGIPKNQSYQIKSITLFDKFHVYVITD